MADPNPAEKKLNLIKGTYQSAVGRDSDKTGGYHGSGIKSLGKSKDVATLFSNPWAVEGTEGPVDCSTSGYRQWFAENVLGNTSVPNETFSFGDGGPYDMTYSSAPTDIPAFGPDTSFPKGKAFESLEFPGTSTVSNIKDKSMLSDDTKKVVDVASETVSPNKPL